MALEQNTSACTREKTFKLSHEKGQNALSLMHSDCDEYECTLYEFLNIEKKKVETTTVRIKKKSKCFL